MDVRVLANPDAVAELASAAISRRLAGAGRRVSLGLAGGGTPRTTYLRLRDESVPWEQVDVWLGDERWVPPDDRDSNLRMAHEALLDHVPAHVHPVRWELGDPEAAAADYAATLAEVLPQEGGMPRADLVLLGIGGDGHTASLFPGTAALEERERWYVANWVPEHDTWRLTATLPLLGAAREIMFLVTGAGKADAVAAILRDGEPLPARLVADAGAEVTWFLDAAAAAHLD